MSDQVDQQDEAPRRRGEAAWKADRERIAARNDQARKAGRARRDAYEGEKDRTRRANERRQMAALADKRPNP
jgi:hypothetical protein